MKNDESSLNELRALVKQGAANRWGSPDKEIATRLEEELAVVEAVGCAAYFTFVAKFVAAIRSAGGLVGPGRGAASDGMRKAMCMRLCDQAEKYKKMFTEDRWRCLWNAAGHLFPKAHYVCTERLYAQMAYLKTYYPLEWSR